MYKKRRRRMTGCFRRATLRDGADLAMHEKSGQRVKTRQPLPEKEDEEKEEIHELTGPREERLKYELRGEK